MRLEQAMTQIENTQVIWRCKCGVYNVRKDPILNGLLFLYALGLWDVDIAKAITKEL